MAKKKSREEIEYHQLLASFRDILRLPAGKEVIWYLLGLCGVYGYIAPDDNVALGRREVGLEILSLLEDVDALTYPQLLLYFNKIAGGRHDDQSNEIDDSTDD